MAKQPCPHCDEPDSSLLRVVLIGEIIRADDETLYTVADLLQYLGLLHLADEEGNSVSTSGRKDGKGIRLIK